MKLFKLEKRKTNPKALYTACMVGLSIAIPTLILAPRVIEAKDGTIPGLGDRVTYEGRLYSIKEIEDDRFEIVHVPTLEKRWVNRNEVKQHPMDIPSEYHWYLALTQ